MINVSNVRMLFVFLGFPMTLAAQDSEAPPSFRILEIRTLGSGCNLGTVALNIASDRQAFTLSFSEFVAELTAASGVTEASKECRVLFDTDHDAGWEYGVLGVYVRGAAYLDEGVRGRQVIQFGARGRDGRSVWEARGPLEQDYLHSEQVNLANLRWSGCRPNENRQRDFAVNTRLVLDRSRADAEGLLTVDSIDGEVRQVYDLVWRRCDGRGPRQLASCTLRYQTPDGTEALLRSKGQGMTPALAIARARQALRQRCASLGQGRASCPVNQAECTTSAL